MGLPEKFAVHEFVTPTTLSWEQVRRLAWDAMEECRPRTSKIGIDDESAAGMDLVLRSWATVEIGRWHVGYHVEAGTARVSLDIVSYLTQQEKVLFIPVMPKVSDALKPFRRFSESFLAAVSSQSGVTA